jgi:MFS transporter, FSR family, fosmidomycin resistance protein
LTGRIYVNGQSKTGQWVQLVLLAAVHFTVDMFGNMLPVLLPVLMKDFNINLTMGGIVVASLILTSNGIQVFTGHLRADKRRPFFLYVGLILSAAICLMALAPRTPGGVGLLIALGVVSGVGIGTTHPEGLRAVHTLHRIRPATATAAFMTTGFLGYAFGGYLATYLVEEFDLVGLYPLLLCPIVGVAAIFLSRVHLAVDSDHESSSVTDSASQQFPFGAIMAMALPAAIATTIVTTLLPTHLKSLGFALKFGGFSTMMFGWGGTVGPYLWAALAHRKGDLRCSSVAFLGAVPLVLLYLLFIRNPYATALLFGVGFFATSAYVLTITLARRCPGANLGRRMAWIVGGTWGIAYMVFIPLAWLGEHIGTGVILSLTPIGYLLSGVMALWLIVKYPNGGTRARSTVGEAAAHDHPPI